MRLLEPTFEDVLYVARNMREWDRREIFATRWNDDPAELARDVMGVGSSGWVAALDRPIAVVGAWPVSPGVWNVYCFATNEFSQIRFSLTRHVKRVMIPVWDEMGAGRAECLSIDGHVEAQAWLEYLGAHRESTLRKRGREGQDFHLYAWIR